MLATVACSDPPRFVASDGGGNAMDGGANTGEDGAAQVPESGPRPDRDPTMIAPDGGCATQNSPTTRAPMNMLIVLDRSGSMSECADGRSGTSCALTKWAAAQQGLVRLLESLEDEARVGLMFFPSMSNASSPDGYRVPVVGLTEPLRTARAGLISRIRGASPTGNTPMACAMPQAVGIMQALTNNGSRNIMLITDGSPTDECSGVVCSPLDINCILNASNAAQGQILGAVARGARSSPSIRTFALGTPDAVPTFLSSVATNGLTQRGPGCEPNSCHYTLGSASFVMDLNAALDSVRDRAATCEFELTVDPMRADPTLINVYYTPMSGGAGRYIPRDTTHTNGSITFYGPLCEEVRTGATGSSVQIVYGCPTITPG
jgi:hypothetical protein